MKHELTVQSYGTVWETDGIKLACTCGQNVKLKPPDEPPDYVSSITITLADLNKLEAAHVEGADLRELARPWIAA